MTSAVRLRLFKLRMFDDHCHIVASHDDRGEAVDLPGVDLRGDEAAMAFEAAAPLLEMLASRGGGRELRALSLHLERQRLIATFHATETETTPTVVRIDAGSDYELVMSAAAAVMRYLADCAGPRLARRRVSVPPSLAELTAPQLRAASTETLGHYNRSAESFQLGTRDHDVSQNIDALLRHLQGAGPRTILDLGCGPGRDLCTFRDLGHVAIGLDGALRFVEMAREQSGCEVLHQDFLELDLPDEHFDGIFANASLFHVPSQELPRVVSELHDALKHGGTLFVSNPHGPNHEGFSGGRYGCYLDLETFRRFMTYARFEELEHYYRPPGQPRRDQPWLASVWRKPSEP